MNRVCHAPSVQMCMCAVDNALRMCCSYCAGPNQVLCVCKARQKFPSYVTVTVCPLQSCPAHAHAWSLSCPDMQHGWTCCYGHDQAARCPKISPSLQERGLFGKASSRSSLPLLPPAVFSSPQGPNSSQSNPESTSKGFFWPLNFKGFFSATPSSCSSSQIYDQNDFLSSEASFKPNFHKVSPCSVS